MTSRRLALRTPMKIRTRSGDLRKLFERRVNVQHLAERLWAVPASQDGASARKIMAEAGFDVLGVENGGFVSGYVEGATIDDRPCGQQIKTFHPSELVADSTPLIDVLPLLLKRPRLFVLKSNRVGEIVTRADLQKAPVRMLIFGLISLLEMNLLKLIREHYPEDSWEDLLSRARVQQARKVFEGRRERNEEIDLVDCLQLADKRTIILKNERLRTSLILGTRTAGEERLKRIEELRDRLVHAQGKHKPHHRPEPTESGPMAQRSWSSPLTGIGRAEPRVCSGLCEGSESETACGSNIQSIDQTRGPVHRRWMTSTAWISTDASSPWSASPTTSRIC